MASETTALFEGKLLLAADEKINRGITGIMANRLIERFHIPAMVVHLGDEFAVGSIRSPGNYDLWLLLAPLDDIILNYGGHENALGFSLRRPLWNQFLDRLEIEVSTIQINEIPDTETVFVDAELPHPYITPDIFTLIDRFEPYGEGNSPLVFSSQNLPVKDIALLGKKEPKHVKFILDTGEYKWPAIFWNSADRINEFAIGDKIDMMYSFNRNWYMGMEKPQIIVNKMTKSAVI
jgi:single-stranded-DNA-specific exonuclease